MKWRELKELIKTIPEQALDSTVRFSYDIMVHNHYSDANCIEIEYSGFYPDKPEIKAYLGIKSKIKIL